MRLLLDEQLPHRFRHYLTGHDVRTAKFMGWDGKVNGELLNLARDEFDALITNDHSIPYEQHITQVDVGVVVLYAMSNALTDLLPLVPEILDKLIDIRRGQIIKIPDRD